MARVMASLVELSARSSDRVSWSMRREWTLMPLPALNALAREKEEPCDATEPAGEPSRPVEPPLPPLPPLPPVPLGTPLRRAFRERVRSGPEEDRPPRLMPRCASWSADSGVGGGASPRMWRVMSRRPKEAADSAVDALPWDRARRLLRALFFFPSVFSLAFTWSRMLVASWSCVYTSAGIMPSFATALL